MAKGEEMIAVVYVGPKSFRTASGSGDSHKVILHEYGDAFEVPSHTYNNMKDVLKPESVFDAEQEVIEAQREAVKTLKAETQADDEEEDGDEE